jgi:hypothetical protein
MVLGRCCQKVDTVVPVNCMKSGCLIAGTEQMRELPVFIYTSDMPNRSCTRPESKYPNRCDLVISSWFLNCSLIVAPA